MRYTIEIEKIECELKKGVLTHLGKIMDVMLSDNTLYYITQYPEKFKNGIKNGLWKEGRVLQPIKVLLVSNSNIIEVDKDNDIKFLEKWHRGIKEIEMGKDFVVDDKKIIIMDYQNC